jgi:hypothetical protein
MTVTPPVVLISNGQDEFLSFSNVSQPNNGDYITASCSRTQGRALAARVI